MSASTQRKRCSAEKLSHGAGAKRKRLAYLFVINIISYLANLS
jgi:hypothetical protein